MQKGKKVLYFSFSMNVDTTLVHAQFGYRITHAWGVWSRQDICHYSYNLCIIALTLIFSKFILLLSYVFNGLITGIVTSPSLSYNSKSAVYSLAS